MTRHPEEPYVDPARMRAKQADWDFNGRANEREKGGRIMTIACKEGVVLYVSVKGPDVGSPEGDSLTSPLILIDNGTTRVMLDANHGEALILALQAACAEIHARSVGP